jgi:hypothetical protein
MSLSSRTTGRFQVEQVETRLSPSTLHAAGVLTSAKPMRLHQLLTLAVVIALATAPARAGTYTIAPASSTITLGQSVTLTVNVFTHDPSGPPQGVTDSLTAIETNFLLSGPASPTLNNFKIANDLPSGSTFASGTFPNGSATVFLGANSFSGFQGDIYSFDFTPPEVGTYTFFTANPFDGRATYATNAIDILAVLGLPTIDVLPATSVPEPAGLALAAVACGGLALRAWRRRRAAA